MEQYVLAETLCKFWYLARGPDCSEQRNSLGPWAQKVQAEQDVMGTESADGGVCIVTFCSKSLAWWAWFRLINHSEEQAYWRRGKEAKKKKEAVLSQTT